jgi:peptidoglycan/LPS O-acetylase OafA/YrhL
MGNSAVSMAPLANLSATRRNTNIDALRGIAILMVLSRHAGMAITILHDSNPFTRYFERIGWAGVDLFFVISGYLISGLLFTDYEKRGAIGLSRFYIRRGLKIWPSFYALIAAGLLIEAVMPGHHLTGKGLLAELFFMQDYFHSIWGLTWSLAVEEHFYLTLPLLLIFMIRSDPEKPFDVLPRVFVATAVFSLFCRFVAGWSQDGVVNPLTCLFPTHLRMDGLMFGVLLCYFKRYRPGVFQWMVSWRGGWAVIAAALVLLSAIPDESRHMHTWGFTVLYIAAGFLVVKAVAIEGPRPVRAISSLLARFGIYSYSIYLWQMFFVWLILPHIHIKSHMLFYWASIAGPILFGIVVAKIIEVPVLHFRDRVFPSLTEQRPAPALAEPALESVASS